MATRTKSEAEFDEEIEEIQEFTRETAETQEEKSLDGMLAELRGANNVSVNVYRTGKGRHLAFLFNCAPTDYTLGQLQEKLRDDYGGGEFRVHIREAGQLVANQLIAVEAPKAVAMVAPSPIAQPNSDLATMLIAMQENNRAMFMAMQESQIRQQENMANMMTTLMSSLGNREQPQQSSVAELLGLLATSKNLFASEEKGGPSEFELFLKGVEFGKESNGDENPITALVKSMGPAVVSLAEHAKAAGQTAVTTPRAPQHRVAPPVPAPVQIPQPALQNTPIENAPIVAAPENSSEIIEGEIPMNTTPLAIPADYQEFTVFLPILLSAAQIDADPEVYANLLLDQIPVEKLLPILGDKNVFMTVLSNLPPEFAPYTDWFEETRDKTMLLIEEEIEEAEGENDVHESDTAENGGGDGAAPISDEDDNPPAPA